MLYQVSGDFFNKPKLWCFRLLSSGLFLLPTFCWQVMSWVWHKVPPNVRRYSVGDEFWISPLSASANARHKLRSLIGRGSLDIWKGWVEHILLLCRILHRADVHLHYSWFRITFLQKNMFLQQKVSDRIQNFYLPNSAWNKPNAHRLKSTWLPNCEFRHGLWKYLNMLATPQNTPSLAHHGKAVATPTQAACGKFCRPAVCRTKSTNARNSCYKFCSRTSWFPSSCFMPMHRWHFGGCSGIILLFQPIKSSYIVLNIAPNHFQLHTRLYFAWTFWISSHQALFTPCPPFLSWNCCGLSSINSSGVAPRNQ